MSTEYYIQGYTDEQPDGIAVADVLAAFGKREGDHDNGFYRLRYDENAHCDASLTVRDGLVTAICVHRPCHHQGLYRAIFEVLSKGPYVLFMPGGKAPLVARAEVAAHLPDDMVDALGAPVCVTDADRIPAELIG